MHLHITKQFFSQSISKSGLTNAMPLLLCSGSLTRSYICYTGNAWQLYVLRDPLTSGCSVSNCILSLNRKFVFPNQPLHQSIARSISKSTLTIKPSQGRHPNQLLASRTTETRRAETCKARVPWYFIKLPDLQLCAFQSHFRCLFKVIQLTEKHDNMQISLLTVFPLIYINWTPCTSWLKPSAVSSGTFYM